MRINEVLRERNIHPDQRKHINCVRPHSTESDAHWKKKCKVCRSLYKTGHPYITEAWTIDRKCRFDVLDLEDNVDYEIETGKNKKHKSYKADKEVKA